MAELVELRAKLSAAFGAEGACELVQPDTVLWMYFACIACAIQLMDVDRRQHLVAAIAGVRPHIVVVDALLVRQLVLRQESAKLGPQGLDLLSLLRL